MLCKSVLWRVRMFEIKDRWGGGLPAWNMPYSTAITVSHSLHFIHKKEKHKIKDKERNGSFDWGRESIYSLNKPPFAFQMIAILDSSAVPTSLRPYIMLLLDLVFESPIQRGNTIIPYEEVVRELSADTIYRDSQIGLGLSSGKFSCGPYCTNAVVVIKVSDHDLSQVMYYRPR